MLVRHGNSVTLSILKAFKVAKKGRSAHGLRSNEAVKMRVLVNLKIHELERSYLAKYHLSSMTIGETVGDISLLKKGKCIGQSSGIVKMQFSWP